MSARPLQSPPDWDECISRLLGPRLIGDDPDRRRQEALRLAAAALLAAGMPAMAAEALAEV